LETILASDEEPPPSLAAVARRLAYDNATFRRHFPEACQVLVQRRQQYLAAKKLSARHALEAALASDEEPPPSVAEVARQLAYDPTTLSRHFPELCQTLVERRQRYKAAELLKVQDQLEAVLANDEIPPPSLSEVTRRLEPRSRTLWTFFPELCQAIIERRQQYQESERLRIQHELETILANNEAPPPSLEEVSRRVAANGATLRHCFPVCGDRTTPPSRCCGQRRHSSSLLPRAVSGPGGTLSRLPGGGAVENSTRTGSHPGQ